jgi:voltage-gated potassium channel
VGVSGNTLVVVNGEAAATDSGIYFPSREAVRTARGRVRRHRTPLRNRLNRLALRLGIALSALLAAAVIVWLDRDAYTDSVDGQVDFLDAVYYATVTLSTTGYGDIAPATDGARLMNVFVITPLRILFLIVLIGTTLEELTTGSREAWRAERWRQTLRNHTIVVGFGVKGQRAVETLLQNNVEPESIVVVDPRPEMMDEATRRGLVSVLGDGSSADVLQRAGIVEADKVLVCPPRDDTAVLVTLTARNLNPEAQIAVTVREEENINMVRQSGANAVITSSDAVGRLVGLASVNPALSKVMEDLLTSGSGLEVSQRRVIPREEGRIPSQLDDPVLAVVRGEEGVMPFYSAAVGHLIRGDEVIVVQPAKSPPYAWRTHPDEDYEE